MNCCDCLVTFLFYSLESVIIILNQNYKNIKLPSNVRLFIKFVTVFTNITLKTNIIKTCITIIIYKQMST